MSVTSADWLADVCSSQTLAPSVADARPSIVVLGSSTAVGWGASSVETSYNWRLAELLKLRKPGECLVNLSMPGYTTFDIRSAALSPQIQDYSATDTLANIDKALQLRPALIVIHLPSNDAAWGISFASTRLNLLDMIHRADSAGSRVLLVGAQPRELDSMDLLMEWKTFLDTIQATELVSIWDSLALDSAHYLPYIDAGDNVHPNDSGHAVIFRQMVRSELWQAIVPGGWDGVDTQSVAEVIGITHPASGTYIRGSNVDFEVQFSQPVFVSGTPTLSLTIGDRHRKAVYISGSGTPQLLLRYIVQPGDSDTDGILMARWIDTNSAISILDSNDRPAAMNLIECTTEGSIVIDGANRAPKSMGSIWDTSLQEDFGNVAIPLSSRFSDTDGTISAYVVDGDSTAVKFRLSNDTIRLSSLANANGVDTLVVKATDDQGAWVVDSFVVTVTAVNDIPVVANRIRDTVLSEDFTTPLILPLAGRFSDLESGLTYNLSGTSAVVASALIGETLRITSLANANGADTLVVKATDDQGAWVVDSFVVTATAVNDPPIVANRIRDTVLSEDFTAPLILPLAGRFSDPDGSIATYHADGDSSRIRYTLGRDTLWIASRANLFGSTRLTITAVDNHGAMVVDTFSVVVASVNDPPVVIRSIPDTLVNQDFASPLLWKLSDRFRDFDGTVDSYTLTGDFQVASIYLSGDTIRVNSRSGKYGSDTLVATATDDQNATVSDTFIIQVKPKPASIVARQTKPALATGKRDAFLLDSTRTIVDRLEASGGIRASSLGLASEDACERVDGCSGPSFRFRGGGILRVSIFDNMGVPVVASTMDLGFRERNELSSDRLGFSLGVLKWNQRDARGFQVRSGVYLWKISFVEASTGDRTETVLRMGIRPRK